MPASHSQVVARTEGPTTATWQLHRTTITDLYIKQNRPLKEIMYIMRVNYGLVASVKMYKYRLKAWGIRKNSRASTSAPGSGSGSSSAGKRKDSSSASDDSKASSPQTAASTRTPSPALMMVVPPLPLPPQQLQVPTTTAAAAMVTMTAHTPPPPGFGRPPSEAPPLPLVTENMLQILDHHFRSQFWPPTSSSSCSSSPLLSAIDPAIIGSPTSGATAASQQQGPLLWTPEERRAAMSHRQRVLMAHIMDEHEMPGASGTMRLMQRTFAEIPNLVKQREHWHVPHAMHAVARLQRIPGAEVLAAMTVRFCRDAAQIHLGASHPVACVWDLLASSSEVMDQAALTSFARCVDGHLRVRYGALHVTYLETRLRLRKNDASPEDFGCEVRAVLAAGFPVAELLVVLESIFVEELFKECLYMEVRRFCSQDPSSSLQAAQVTTAQHPGMLAAVEDLSFGSSRQQQRLKPAALALNVPSSSNNNGSSLHYSFGLDSGLAEFQHQQMMATLPVSPTDAVESFLCLINMLQRIARSGMGMSLEELAFIKTSGARLILPYPTSAIHPSLDAGLRPAAVCLPLQQNAQFQNAAAAVAPIFLHQ